MIQYNLLRRRLERWSNFKIQVLIYCYKRGKFQQHLPYILWGSDVARIFHFYFGKIYNMFLTKVQQSYCYTKETFKKYVRSRFPSFDPSPYTPCSTLFVLVCFSRMTHLLAPLNERTFWMIPMLRNYREFVLKLIINIPNILVCSN